MKRNLLGVGILLALWIGLSSAMDRRRSRERRELWAEATRENASR